MTWLAAYQKIIRAKGYKVRFGYLWQKHKKKRKAIFGIWEEGEITINLHKNNPPGRTFVHELLHHRFPEMPHKEVYRLEKEIWANLSQAQKVKIYKKLFQ